MYPVVFLSYLTKTGQSPPQLKSEEMDVNLLKFCDHFALCKYIQHPTALQAPRKELLEIQVKNSKGCGAQTGPRWVQMSI